MTAEILTFLSQAALGASVAALVVLAIRGWVRAQFGALTAYRLWLMVPVAMTASLVPAGFTAPPATDLSVFAPAVNTPIGETATIAAVEPSQQQGAPVVDSGFSIAPVDALVGLWLAGFAMSLAVLLVRQYRFLKAQRLESASGRVKVAGDSGFGPAVVGVLKPSIILPKDFAERYNKLERTLILAHEKAHIRAGDVRVNMVAVLLRAFNWFNPIAYLAVHQFKVDQELACDERVMQRHGQHRKLYAKTLLKSHLMAEAAPIGCGWLPESMHPLKERVARLSAPMLSAKRRVAGTVALAAVTSLSGVTAWGALASHTIELPYGADAETVAERVLEETDDLEQAQGAALAHALTEGRRRHARALIKAGADVNYFLPGDGTPLLLATRMGDEGLVKLLLDSGADPNKAAPGDGSALIVAARRGDEDITKMLLAAGADPNGFVMGDETPLIGAAAENSLDVARLLIEAGADVNLKVRTGNRKPRAQYRSPMGQARAYGNRRMAELLRSHGAKEPTERED